MKHWIKVAIMAAACLCVVGGCLGAQEKNPIAAEHEALNKGFQEKVAAVKSREEYMKLMAERNKQLEAVLQKHQNAGNQPALELARARILLDLQKLDEAAKKADAVLAGKTALSGEAALVKARILIEQGNGQEAVKLFKKFETTVRKNDDYYEVCTAMAYMAPTPADREAYTRRLIADKNLPAQMKGYIGQLQANLAELMAKRGDRAGAVKLLEQAVAASKDPREQKSLKGTLTQLGLYGKPAPEVSAPTWFNSTPLQLAALKGKVVVIDFWAPWCGPCRQVIPALVDTYAKLKDKGLVVIGFTKLYGSYRDDQQDKGAVKPEEETALIKKFSERFKITYPVAVAPDGKSFDAYGVSGIPTLVVIDKQGKVAEVKVGSGDEAALVALINKLLAAK